MKKIIYITPLFLCQSLFGHGPHGQGNTHHSHEDTSSLLQYYSGDFTDSDNDGMTDIAESKYGYNPNSSQSFPDLDFVVTETDSDAVDAIDSYNFIDAMIFQKSYGICLKWNQNDPSDYAWKYGLSLYNGDDVIFNGGHDWDFAKIDYSRFGLDGTEELVGQFEEHDPTNGEHIKSHPQFNINLNDYPITMINNEIGANTNQIKFKFVGFSDEQKTQYTDFIRRLIPIFNDVVGYPAESFVCEFIMNEESSNSWVTLDHGRVIELDSNWNPRLLVHEMVHMWDGKYAFCWSGEHRDYEDRFSGFAEIAEGIAYKILHEYVMAYPTHSVSVDTINGGAWNNWSCMASTYDLQKHQRFTGGGTFWTGELRTNQNRYNNSAMFVQTILVENPSFVKDMRQSLFEILRQNPSKILEREEIVNLWANTIDTVNGIDFKKYINAIPVFNGRKLDQGFYPIMRVQSQYDLDVFSSYAVDGNFWWLTVTPDNIDSFNIPDWVNRNLGADGWYYLDMNNMPYTLKVKDVFGEVIQTHDLVSDNTYQNDSKIVPLHLGEIRLSDTMEIAPNHFPTGLYVYNLTYTEVIEHTDEATEDFYFMGQQNIDQREGEYVLMFGVDSKFAESIVVKLVSSNLEYELPVKNGCAVLQTSDIPFNTETMMEIKVSSNDESFTYKRALVHAGDPQGEYRQQFLIIDRDFDGIEDLYDGEVSELDINTKYTSYYNKHHGSTDGGSTDDGSTDDGSTDDGSTDDESTDDDLVDVIITDWDSAELIGNGWRFLDWFGYFYISEQNPRWFFHVDLGWLYVPSDNFNSVWMFSEKYGWIWTSEELFPFIYFRFNGWSYFDFQKKVYFEFKSSSYITF